MCLSGRLLAIGKNEVTAAAAAAVGKEAGAVSAAAAASMRKDIAASGGGGWLAVLRNTKASSLFSSYHGPTQPLVLSSKKLL